MERSQLFYSKYCEHSKNILEELNKSGFHDKFEFICIDKRVTDKNIIYILDNNKPFIEQSNIYFFLTYDDYS